MQDDRSASTIADFFNRFDRLKKSHLILDYDGTLAPFQEDRAQAYPYPGVLPLLARITESDRTAMSIVTGRPVNEIQHLLGPLNNFDIWGAHGLEYVSRDGVYRQAEIDPRVGSVLHSAEDWLRQSGFHSFAEIKPGGIAVHWRGVHEWRVQEIQRQVEKNWARFSEEPGIRLLRFDGGVEIRADHPNKGDAVQAVLANVEPASSVALLGDDLTDEDGFRVLGERGLSVLVRPEYRTTSAKAWLRPPQDLIAFLKTWINTLR